MTIINSSILKDLSENIQKICGSYNIRIMFKNSFALRRNTFQIKPNIEKNMTKQLRVQSLSVYLKMCRVTIVAVSSSAYRYTSFV